MTVTNIPLGLYIHLPWCIRKCPYCDFNSHELTTQAAPFEAYVDSLLADLDASLAKCENRTLTTIFLGGGTPSLFPGDVIGRLLEGIKSRLPWCDDIEVTLEANPGAAEGARFRSFREAGVNRLSIGVQSFRDNRLRELGRVHDGAAARMAIDAAYLAGFENINIDLMYGLPGDSVDDSLSDLRAAIAFGPRHISWYELTIEPHTAFSRSPPTLPKHDDVARAADHGRELLAGNGFEQYEISAYGHGPVARARHNINYWEFGDYIGIGAGAHGKITTDDGIFRTEKRRSPQAYLSSAGTSACTERHGPLTPTVLTAEFAMNAFRLIQGYPEALFQQRTGLPLSIITAPLDAARNRGWITRDNGRIRPTELGSRFLNDLQLLFVE